MAQEAITTYEQIYLLTLKEDLLHYVWKNKLLISNQLETTHKEFVQLINVGNHNYNSGPDFFNAKIKINNQLWAGNVEIHVKSSDWYVHGHEKDSNYDSIILHVVWDHDMEVYRKDNSLIPTLKISDYIDKKILNNYQKLFSAPEKWINCENELGSIDQFLLDNWFERLYIERLEEKSRFIQQLLDDSKNDWEAVLYKMLFKNFGLKVNGDAFLNLANSLDFSIIRKEKPNIKSIESLLFGQAGLLNGTIQEGYYRLLQNEFEYLQKKYKLPSIFKSQVQFFRLRPNNFPTIRLAQLSALLHQHKNLFSEIMETYQLKDFYKLFNVSISEFWKTHYSFTAVSKKSNKKLTASFVDLLLINTIVPLQFMYFKQTNKLDEAKLINIIRQIKPEKNAIIDKFNKLKIISNSALESQALLQLRNDYCTKQKCVQCAIGNLLIRNH